MNPLAPLLCAPMLRLRSRPQGFVEPCLPSPSRQPPAGPGWIHEIKHDGYRLIVRREGAATQFSVGIGHAIEPGSFTAEVAFCPLDGDSLNHIFPLRGAVGPDNDIAVPFRR